MPRCTFWFFQPLLSFYAGVTRSASPSVDASALRPDLPALASDCLSAKAA